jgi:hypothetical protein
VLTVRVGEESLHVRTPGRVPLGEGAAVRLGWKPGELHVFDAASGMRQQAEMQMA